MTGRVRLAVVAVVVLVTLGLAWSLRVGHSSAPRYRLTTVEVGPLRRTVKTTGQVVSRDVYRGFSPFDASLVWIIPEGSRVKKGDVVARLDVRKLKDRLDEKSAERNMALQDQAIRTLDLELEAYEVENRVQALQEEVNVARIACDLAERGIDIPRLVELTHQIDANRALVATLAASTRELAPYIDRGFVSRDEMERQAVKLAGERLMGQVLSLDKNVVTSGNPPDKKAQAARDLAVAQISLDQARHKLATFRQRRGTGVSEIRERIDNLSSEIAAITTKVASGTLVSRLDGIVIHEQVYTGSNRRERPQPGTRIWPGMLFIQVARPESHEVELSLAEDDASLVKEGQPCDVTVETRTDAAAPNRPGATPSAAGRRPPGRRYAGTIRKLAAALTGGGRSTYFFPASHTLRGRITLADGARVRPGMGVTVIITVKQGAPTLWIPAQAVEGDRVLLDDGTPRIVDTGVVEGDRVEVRAGLSAGDRIRVSLADNDPDDMSGPCRPVAVRDLVVKLADLGTLDTVTTLDIAVPEMEGETPIRELLPEGSLVKKGQVVARLDGSAFKSKLQEKELQLKVAQKDLEVVFLQSEGELAQLEEEAKVAAQDLQVAILDEQLTLEGERSRKLADLARDLELARADIERISRELGLKEQLARRGYVSAEEIKKLRLDMANRKVALEVASVKLDLARQGATALERQRVRSSRRKAQLNLDLAQRKVASRGAKRRAELARTQVGVDKAQLAARRLARMVESCTVRAPADGAVVITETWSNDGNRKMRVGDSIGEGRAFMRLADLSRFQVRGVVPEERVDEVRPGQPVRFWLPTAVDHVFAGKVQSVGTVARVIQTAISFSDRSSERRAFDLVVSTAEHAARFQPGLSVRYEVELAVLRQIPVVSVEALYFDQDGSYARLPSGERRALVLGEESEGEVQVLRGLVPGEVVRVHP